MAGRCCAGWWAPTSRPSATRRCWIQIFIVYFGLSSLGLKLSAEVSAVLALTINMGAYTTEIMRAGIESIQRTQLEAADCLA